MPNTVTLHESGAMLPDSGTQQAIEKIFEPTPDSFYDQVTKALEADYKENNPSQPTLEEYQKAGGESQYFQAMLKAADAQTAALLAKNARIGKECDHLQAQSLQQTEDLQIQADKISELNAHLTASRKALGEQTQRLHELQALYMRMSAQVLMALEAAKEKEYEQSLQKEL